MLNAAAWPSPLRKTKRNQVLQILPEICVCPAELLNWCSREVLSFYIRFLCAVDAANECVLRLCNKEPYVGFLGRTILLFFLLFSYFCPNAWPSFRQRRSEPEWTKQSVHVAEPSKHSMTHYPASICDITVVTSVTSFKVLYSTIAFSIWTAAEMRFVSKNRGWIL